MNRKLVSLIVPICLLAIRADAADYYLTPAGAGLRNGSNWANAYAQTSLSTVLNTTMAAGDTLYLGSGAYGGARFTISSSGTSTGRKSLIGVDTGGGIPSFKGAETTRSYTTITLAPGVGYWTIKNLKIEHRDIGLSASGAAGLVIEGVITYDVRTAGLSFADCDNILLKDCRSDRYSERGFRFIHSCDGVTIRNCVADFTGTGDVDDPGWRSATSTKDPVGFDFQVKGSTTPFNTNILMEDCEARNNDEDTADTSDYEQGDGVMLQSSNDGVTLRRCRFINNQDGGIDAKGSNQLLEDCYATRNKRYGFKLWYEGTLNNCIAVGNGIQFVMAALSVGNTITLNYCTLHCLASTATGARVETAGNTVVLNNSIISFAGAAGPYLSGSGSKTLTNTAQHANAANNANAPGYVNPISPWDGSGTNYDSLSYGLAKGYNSGGGGTGGSPIVYEGESLTVTSSGASTTTYAEASASAGVYSHLLATAIGHSVTYMVNVPAAGTYNVKAGVRRIYNRGTAQMAIDGVNQGALIDTYAVAGEYVEIDQGDKSFGTSGNKAFKFTVTGKNASSSGYGFSIDYFKLTPQ